MVLVDTDDVLLNEDWIIYRMVRSHRLLVAMAKVI
jgi:hypothetical protein